MPTYRTKGGWMHLKMTNTKKHPAPKHCVARVELEPGRDTRRMLGIPPRTAQCCAMSTFLCDWPVEGGTCDAPLCDEHATEVGKNRHYCPKHLAEHRAAAPELF